MATQKTKKALSPIFPLSQNTLYSKEIVFKWIPLKKSRRSAVTYNLYIYSYNPKKKIDQLIREKPIHIVRNLKEPHYKFPGRTGKFRKNKAYIWRVEAKDKESRKIHKGKIEGFRITSEPDHTLNSDMTILHRGVTDSGESGSRVTPIQPDSTVRALLPNFYPHPPLIWGCPVKLKPMDRSTEPEPSPSETAEDPVETDPLALVWGSDAARLFLIPSLCRNLRVFWDYRYIDNCEQVVLQISNWDTGFQDPNSENALSDSGVTAWYKGPSFIDHQFCGTGSEYLLSFEDGPPQYNPHNINIHHTGELRLLLGPNVYYLRLVPLDAAGNQLEPASDQVTVVCVDYPSIDLAQLRVEYEWGESPLRRIIFSIRLNDEFPSFYPLCTDLNTPISFVVWGAGGGTSMKPVTWEDIRFIRGNGTELPIVGTWWGQPHRFFQIDDWETDSWHTFYYEQTCNDLAGFTDLKFAVDCIPGISLDWTICTGRLTDDERPIIGSSEPCVNPELNIDIYDPGHLATYGPGIGEIFHLFTGNLSGTRISGDGVEEFVEVRFRFIIDGTVNFPNYEEFRAFAILGFDSTTYVITMEETIGGTTQEYDFRWSGFYAELRNIEDRTVPSGAWGLPLYSGPVIFNPPRMELRFDGLVYRLEQ
jgi:hypothetical protein